MPPRGAEQGPTLSVVALVRRERARALLRVAFPRRRTPVQQFRTAAEVEAQLTGQLVDAVLVDGGAGEDTARLAARAQDFPSIPFFLVTPLLPQDAPVVARSVAHGVCEVLVEGLDDVVARDLLAARAFSTRFERALAVPPAALALETPLQLSVWRTLVRRAGRPVRTDELARAIGVSREHLSRSFAAGSAPTLKRVIDLVRLLAAAELAKNPGHDLRDVAAVLGFASSSHLSATTQRLVGARAASLARLRGVDLVERFLAHQPSGDEAGATSDEA